MIQQPDDMAGREGEQILGLKPGRSDIPQLAEDSGHN
jgi:hypothetical protein